MKCKLPELLRIHQECRLMVSGIKRIAIANWEDTYKFTSSNDCNIDSIDLNDEHFYEINFAEGSAYANANVNAGSNSEQKSVQHQVGFVLPVIDCKLIDNWKNYLLARVIFAVETKSNQVFIFGADNGLSTTNFDYSTGTSETDTNGITALFEASQTNAPLIVQDWSLIEALYPQDEPDFSKEYLTFEALESGTFTLTVPQDVDSTKMTSISYSTDNGTTWVDTAIDNTRQTITTPTIAQGKKVLWKGVGTRMTVNGWSFFESTSNFNVSGNIMSMLYGDNFENQTSFPSGSEVTFVDLFAGCVKLINAENLILPATTLVSGCYRLMFNGCTALTSTPELPATTLAGDTDKGCYQSMFRNCTSLTTAPELPATTLADYCYQGMFQGCTTLTIAPELPATTLASNCYEIMFAGCTALTTAPELPATTLAYNCYYSMFNGCTSLTTAPTLPARRLEIACYNRMFQNCTSLNHIKILATGVNHIETYMDYWVYNVAANGTFIKVASQTIPTGVSGIPEGWTVLSEKN